MFLVPFWNYLKKNTLLFYCLSEEVLDKLYIICWNGEKISPPLCRQECLSYTGATPFFIFSNGRFWPLTPFQTIQQQHFPPGLEGWIKLYISHFLTVLAFLPEREEKPYKVSFGPNPKTSAAAGGRQVWLWWCPQWGLWGLQQPPGPFLGRGRCWAPERGWLGGTFRLLIRKV